MRRFVSLLKEHINKHCAGIGSLQFKYDYNRDHEAPKNQPDGVPTNREANILCVEAELKTQDDDISNKLSTMMEDTPKDCMGQSLKCHYTFTKKARMGGGMINVTLESGYKFDEKPESYLESDRDGIFSPDTFPKVNEFFREPSVQEVGTR